MLAAIEVQLEPQRLQEELEAKMARAAQLVVRFDAIDWSASACRQAMSLSDQGVIDVFFSEQVEDIRMAKEICAECPLNTECFALALANAEPWGVWGGELFVNGKPLAVKRPRGRPPKDAALQKSA